MILLLLAALERRAGLAGDARHQVPVPAWLSVSGWDPETEPLHDWAANVLSRDYPSLRAPGYGGAGTKALIVLGWVITAAAVTWLLAWQQAGRAPLVTLAQVVLRFRPGSSVSFTRLLEDALARQVLRQAGAVYQFRHTTLQTRLAIRYRSEPPP